MQWFSARVISNQNINDVFSLITFENCKALKKARPGQFVMLRGAWARDPILPRAYSILNITDDQAEFLIRPVGRGSQLLCQVVQDNVLDVLGPLGNSFPLPEKNTQDLLVAGGCGLPPLHFAAQHAYLNGQADQVELLVGAKTAHELVLLDRLADWNIRHFISTEDGSQGDHGLVTDLLARRIAEQNKPCRILACGPDPMLKAVRDIARKHGFKCLLSLESAMACGLGACLGCAIPAKNTPYLHVCKDGPVLDGEEIWPS